MAFVHGNLLATYMMLLVVSCHASSKFLSDNGNSPSAKAFREEIMNAMGSILGCGGHADQKDIAAIRAVVKPMWHTMPKTNDRIDRRSLRYVVHRYFMQTSSLMVRGFEPSRSVNDSHWGAADILSQMVPAYVESVLESKHNTQKGFTMQDVVDMVITLDQLIFDSESSLLEGVYENQHKAHERALSHQGVKQVVEEYLIKWMVDADPEDQAVLLANRTLTEEILPHYKELMLFGEGRIKAWDFERRHRSNGRGNDVFATRYSFEDVHQVVGGITRSFQSYWQSECDTMKDTLVGMDKHSTGRVPLSKFYGTGLDLDWRFGESEAYLRELGALDESSSWMGPQVIIPNYIQATSNCIISRPHYLVCCVNECESLLGELESAIKAPTALPSAILDFVRTMTSQTTLDHDEPPHLDKNMVSQLEQVAKNHGGMVPLHGRLFAQWLHFVFPRECPFPHKMGAVTAATPTEYGDNYIATTEDMQKHASTATDVPLHVDKAELQWMSQWSPDEELVMDYQSELQKPWQWRLFFLVGCLLLIGGGIGGGVLGQNTKKDTGMSSFSSHSHYV